MMRRFAWLLLGLTLPAGAQNMHLKLYWEMSWTASPQTPITSQAAPASMFRNTTVRQIVHLSTGGNYVRVRLSNLFGAGPLRVTSVHIADAVNASSPQIAPGTDTAVTFNGKPDVTIPAGAAYFSDPVKFDAKPLSNLAVSLHLDEPPMPETFHRTSNEISYLAHGDQASAETLNNPGKIAQWFWLTGIEIGTPTPGRCVVALGDSITDGTASGINQNARWTDDLARRLQANPPTRDVCVMNEGIGGDRVLMDGMGPSAISRFDRDVLSQPGAKYLIVFAGINDLGVLARQGDVPEADVDSMVQEIIAAYQQMIDAAHAHGMVAIGSPLTPFRGSIYYTQQGSMFEAARQVLNAWIRQSGHFDDVIDFDQVMRDPQQPDSMSPSLSAHDHIHANASGYNAMANAINLKRFQ